MKNNNRPSYLMRRRLFFVVIVVSLLFFYISVSYYKIQIVQKDYYSKKALANQMKTFEVKAKRGNIFDRNGEKLAYSVSRYRVYLDKRVFDIENRNEIIKILGLSEEKFDYLYENKKNSYTLMRQVTEDMRLELKIADFAGIWMEDDSMRVYPNDDLASRVIGHTNIDLDGIVGVEYSMDDVLKGTDGMIRAKTDAIGRRLPYGKEEIVDPINGLDVYLTIDEVIQHFTEKSIQKGIEVTGAKNIYAIVTNVKTGEILSMASMPTYDLNNPWEKPVDISEEEYEEMSESEKVKAWNENWKNPTVSSIYEPGSTFKIVTAAIGLEENVVYPTTVFNEQTGYVNVYDRKIRCWYYPNHHGKETFVEAMENSCNPVFVKVGQNIGRDNFYDGLIKFGLNDEQSIQLPGVVEYKVREKEKIGPVELATMSYGHGISVTPIQLVRTLNAIINNGNLVEPSIIKKIVNDENIVVDENQVVEKRKIISDKTSRDIRLMLESVVNNGSGKAANVSGIRVGGKTGTTIKLQNGLYNEEKGIASFYGFAPVDDPEISVLVIVDEPEESVYGSVIAAPIFKEIMESALRQIGVKPNFKE